MILCSFLNNKILITGSDGFISKRLKSYLINKSYDVISTSRVKGDRFYFDLKNELNTEYTIPHFDILIHLSYLREYALKEEKKHNINGAKNIFSLAKKYNAKIIYISSQNANPNSYSNYGKIKYAIEKIASQFNSVIIRPGLIYDKNSNAGIFGNIDKLIKKMPFIIVPSGLNKKLNLCNIESFNETINDILINTIHHSKIDLYERENYNLFDLVKHIAKINNKKIKILLLNYKIILFLLIFLEFFNIELTFKSDSLKSLIK